MGRLIVISNRVAVPDVDQAQAGGLAVALNDALSTYGGLWLGWSGRTVEGATTLPHITTHGNVAYALLDLTPEDYAEYYNGFANRTLWPLFHYRLDMAEFDRVNYQTYLKVNTFFATALLSLLQPDDIIWVHDYHLIPLGQELRRLGVTQRIGIFMHTPFPALEIMLTLPSHARLVQSMSAYDVVGFQTINDLRSFLDYVAQEANGKVDMEDGTVLMGERTLKAAVFAIGLDAESMAAEAVNSFHTPSVQRLQRTLHGRALLIGVDRLDYSKGIPERLRAYARFLERHPPFRKKVTFLQISPVSRGDVPEYRRLRRNLEQEAGRINGQHGEPDWVPVRYVSKGYKRATLAGYYRTARVAVVTPLRDGMNLVAKEFVVAQNPDSPGVLVLSRFAGAAHELEAALLVNPYDLDDVADAMARALSMPLEERLARWQQMHAVITTNTLSHWCENFLNVLRGGESIVSA
ncbi:Alpha,alpha-trehalose-phosphate synthase [UDP-forming] [invertebrate metagenome]|uniref:alpha,alpha-trehalose-phosphate synthase (UDP-forming) n=1 Tax=invertebrate metagenome TaxID=1711999 RepID=A0A484HBT2_9ZZZZ